MKITIFYSCAPCNQMRVALEVEARRPDQDLFDWMDGLTTLLIKDHAQRSPNCRANDFSEVLIPIGNEDKVGAARTEH